MMMIKDLGQECPIIMICGPVHYYPCNVVEIKFAHFFLDEESVMFILDSVFLISITEMYTIRDRFHR
ncbi:hypothetical protein DERF_008607 [Dermatophagoides farinae]|uniref:Uncharacterized protein n=1 Tax=Dermatophagoides farinae TaxID=6954 RepID=A0A922I3T2_DERFA|nr:hypothetical protein DERF_008607 [Dermatophagoides farinae]